MAQFVKVILLLLFTVAFYSVVNDFSAAKVEQQSHAAVLDRETKGSVVSKAEVPHLPEVELIGGGAPMHQLTMSRVQRVSVIEYSLSLKGLVQSLANREAALSQHLRRIYDTTTSYYCHPASQYYVFALRRIII